MNLRIIGFALCFLLIGVLGTLLLTRPIHEGQANADALNRLSTRLDRLEAQLSNPSAQATPQAMVLPGNIVPPPSAGTATNLASISQSESASGAESSLRSAQRATELEARFSAEKRTSAWAAPAEKRLADSAESEILAQANLVPETFQTSCKSSRCRVRASFASANAAQEWGNLYIVGAAGTLSQAQIIQKPLPGGRAELTIYGTR